MNIWPQQHDTMKKVGELVEGLDTGILTAGSRGRLISRPMEAIELDKFGDFWFFTSYQAASQLDLGFINVAFSDADREIYVSLSGAATLVRDPRRIEELWNPRVKPWFAEGHDDPDLVLMRFVTHTAAYWDAKNSIMTQLMGSVTPTAASRRSRAIPEHEVLANPVHF